MISKELKEVIEIAKGKVIISEGSVEKSYIVMKLSDYLKEQKNKKEEKLQKNKPSVVEDKRKIKKWLTDENNLDKMEIEIDELYHREKEKEMEELLKAEREDYSYERV